VRAVWGRWRPSGRERERISGEPTSANGASSLHLFWEVPPLPYVAAAVTLEVLQPPVVRRLYFWALQVSFLREERHRGGAHLGLQWNPGFPGSTAANWGGYAPQEVGGLLSGSVSELPSTRHDLNTRDLAWVAGRRYRLGVLRAPESPTGVHSWRGTITDLESGAETVVRDLYADAPYLGAPMVWTEAFARCEHPGVAARWSDPSVTAADGRVLRPARMRVNYQARRDGGCDNTTAIADELGIVQVTHALRETPQGAVLPVPDASA
jgi:hypothetical protein